MTQSTFPAFSDEQLEMLRRLLSKAIKAENDVTQGPKSKAAKRRARQRAAKANPLSVIPEHEQRAKEGDFSWIPRAQKDMLQYLQSRPQIEVLRQDLILLGQISWREVSPYRSNPDTLIMGSKLRKVIFLRIDPAVEAAFTATRLGWAAIIKDGEAPKWDPVKIRLSEPTAHSRSRHLHLGSVLGKYDAINEAIRVGALHLAVMRPLRIPKQEAPKTTREAGKQVPKTKKEKKLFPKIIVRRPSGTNFEGSSLVASMGLQKTTTKSQLNSSAKKGNAGKTLLGSIVVTPKKVRQPNRGKYLGKDMCVRCDGGNLPNCPKCDGRGWIDVYEKDSPSAIRMARATDASLSGQMGGLPFSGNSASVADHEAVGRADPNDANRSASIMRDDGKFGSMPLYDDYDE